MKQVVSACKILGIVALLAPLAAMADSHAGDERPPLTDVWLVMPKQGMEQEFEDAARAHMAFRDERWLGDLQPRPIPRHYRLPDAR